MRVTPGQKDTSELKIVLASLAGNILEWYDFGIFGFFSDIIGDVFFPPNQEGNAALLEAFTVFGLAFLVRPIGGAIIGKMGDTHGRKGALETSIFLMAFPTFALGCLPTYSQVGWLSTVLLILVRLLQGISVGGQLTSAIVFNLERTHVSQWGFWASAVYAASSVGVTLGSLLSSVLRETLTTDQVNSWGWRIPFWLGALGALPAIYLRIRAEDQGIETLTEPSSNTPSITINDGDQNQNSYALMLEEDFGMEMEVDPKLAKDPIMKSLAKPNRMALLAVTLVTTLPATAYYITFVWLVIFMESLIEDPIPQAFTINTINSVVGGIIFVLFAGWLADRVKNYVMLMTVSGILLAIIFPLTLGYIGSGLGHNATTIAFFLQLLLSMLSVIWIGAMLPWMVLIFPPEIRLTSVSLGYNISVSIWGGFSPLVATLLVDQINNSAPGYLATFAVALGLVGLFIAPSIDYDEFQDEEKECTMIDSESNENRPLLL